MPVDESAELQQLIMMSGQAPDDQVEDVLLRLSEAGSYGRVAPGRDSIVISAFGDREMISSLALENIPGGDYFGLIAGPCTVESREQTLETARAVNAAGATMLRGGAFKPRTSPYSFQGLGSEALAILAEAREDTGLPLVTEVLDPRQLEEVVETADVLQIGARNMQNFLLLAEVGKTDKPVLLKRGSSASLEELLMAAEYILKEGNPRVILCERGIKTFERSTRFTLDISAVPVLQEETHLPVIVAPSHPAGRRELVPALARAAVAAGADGIIVEAHPAPEEALCDAPQLIPTSRFAEFADDITRLVEVMGKSVG